MGRIRICDRRIELFGSVNIGLQFCCSGILNFIDCLPAIGFLLPQARFGCEEVVCGYFLFTVKFFYVFLCESFGRGDETFSKENKCDV